MLQFFPQPCLPVLSTPLSVCVYVWTGGLPFLLVYYATGYVAGTCVFVYLCCNNKRTTTTTTIWCQFWRLLETFWPQDSTNLCNSPAVILGDSFATQTILLTVRGVNGWFLTSPVALKFLTIAMIVEMGIFNCLEIFFYPFPDLCSSTTSRRTLSLCPWVFPIVMSD